MNLNKTTRGLAIITLLVALSVGLAFADSMLTSTSDNDNDGLLIIDAEGYDELSKELAGDDVMAVTLKRKADSVWGPQSGKSQTVISEDTSAGVDTGKCPAIYVKYKVKISSDSSSQSNGKYKHSYKTSRSKTTEKVMDINITPIIIREAKKNNIDPLLLKGVIQTESSFNTYAVSPAGAAGLCQLMPMTAQILGVQDRYNPEQSIAGGARYLGTLKEIFGSTDLILAAYNAGPGCVKRTGGVPDIPETKDFIKKVKKNMKSW